MNKSMIGLMLLSVLGFSSVSATAQERVDSTVTVEGQVVCSSCWFEADRKVKPYGDEGDLKCAVTCANKGISQAVAVASDKGFTLYLLEPGKLKRERKDWLDYIAKRVRATGTIRDADNKRYLRVDSIEVLASETSTGPAKQEDSQSQKGPGIQSVEIRLTNDGYQPISFELKRDLPARVTFVRESKVTCGTEVVIPEYKIKRALPLNEPVVLEFTPHRSGEFAFTCGMGMLRGKLIVQ